MAKAAAKSAAKEPKKTTTTRVKAASGPEKLVKVSEEVLEKLRALGVEPQLQNDIEWCLGSYRADGNPVGLYTMGERALAVLKAEKDKKTKGVTTKLIGDLEKVVKDRQS